MTKDLQRDRFNSPGPEGTPPHLNFFRMIAIKVFHSVQDDMRSLRRLPSRVALRRRDLCGDEGPLLR
jgi:hypothetical protein